MWKKCEDKSHGMHKLNYLHTYLTNRENSSANRHLFDDNFICNLTLSSQGNNQHNAKMPTVVLTILTGYWVMTVDVPAAHSYEYDMSR